MASLGWIHFSRSFRDRVNTVLDMMDEEGMVDELGVGAFRDAFADIFFPGISTIQTRAKYFFIIPYLIKDYVNLPGNKQNGLDKYLYEAEHEIMWELAAKYNHKRNSGSGVIGITKTPRNRISRRPSSVYWNGLRILGFMKTSLSFAEYSIRINEILKDKLSRKMSDKKEDSDDEDVALASDNGIKVSTYQNKWKQGIDMPLNYEEADFFRQTIIRSVPSTFLYQLIAVEKLRKDFLRCKDFRSFVGIALKENLPEDLKIKLTLAHDLDVVVEGLHWVYSNEINKHHYQDERYYEKWTGWTKTLYDEIIDLENLKGETLILIAPRANYYSKLFIIKVLQMIRQRNLDYDTMAILVKDQERDIKKYKSRFKPNSEKDFKMGEVKSLSFLNYRFTNAKTIITDIFKPLTEPDA
jgi:hypothetical protein